MKNKYRLPLLLAIAALGLASCGEAGGTSDESSLLSSSEETSETASESTTSEEPIETGSSEEPIDTSSSEESSTTTEYNWPTWMIAGYLVSHLGYRGEYSIPTPSAELDAGREYNLQTGAIYTSQYDYFDVIRITAEGDFTAYGEEVKATEGWTSIPYYENNGEYLLYSADYNLEIYVSSYDSTSDNTIIDIELSQGYYAGWPEEILEGLFGDLVGEGSTPLPAIEDVEMFLTAGTSSGYFLLNVYSDTDADGYAEILKENGFLDMTYLTYEYYVAPEIEYLVLVDDTYWSYYGFITIRIYSPSYAFDIPETADDIDFWVSLYVEWYVNENIQASLPSAHDVDFDLATFSSSYSAGYVRIWFWKWRDGELVDLTDEYAALLDGDSDWTYSADLDGYIDTATATAAITLEGPEAEGDPSLLVKVQSGDYSEYL